MGGHHDAASQSLLLRALPKSLPKVQVWKLPAARNERELPDSLERFGFNVDDLSESSKWKQELHYTRWVPPLEQELASQVEYDMDDADKEWLDSVNAELWTHDNVSYEVFEILIDKLEKLWFSLQRQIPKPGNQGDQANMPAEDSLCAICDDGECEASNAIVFCDGCNLAVHQDCYGVPYIPEGQWLCRKCTVSPDRPVSCALCPVDYGAFKQTTNGKWAHLLCAIWINETGVSNTVYMEPIDGVDAIPKGRWKLICYLCKRRTGAPIQCSKGSCYTAYHATCAREYGLHLRLGTNSGMATSDEAPGQNVSYCDKHGPSARGREESEELGTPGAGSNAKKRKLLSYGERHGSVPPGTPGDGAATPRSSTGPLLPLPVANLSRAHNKALAPLPAPIIPQYIYDKLWDYIKPLKFRQKALFVKLVCRYWSLKRESRRGAPLLKRLHLEPWTAAGASRQATDIEKEKKLELLLLLRNDLEKVRTLTELVKKREREKLRRAQMVKSIVEQLVLPRSAIFRAATRSIIALDARGLFTAAVDRAEVPDYYDIITEPMWWQRILEKIDENAYLRPKEFSTDVYLVLDNALKYNRPEDKHAKAALKLKSQVQPVLNAIEKAFEPDSEVGLHQLHRQMLDIMDDDLVKNLVAFSSVDPAGQQQDSTASLAPVPRIPAAQHAAASLPRMDAGVAALTSIMSTVPQPVAAHLPASAAAVAPFAPEVRVLPASGPSASGRSGSSKAKKRKRTIPQDDDHLDPTAANGFRVVGPEEAIAAPQPGTSLSEWEKREAMLARKREVERIKREAKRANAGKSSKKKRAPSAGPSGVPTALPSVGPSALMPDTTADTAVDQSITASIDDHTMSATDASIILPEELRQAQPAPVEEVTTNASTAMAIDNKLAIDQARQDDAVPTIAAPEPEPSAAESLPPPTFATAQQINEWGMEVDRESVTNHDSFLLFNSGWVLPEGSTRRRARSAFPETSNKPNTASKAGKGQTSSPMARTAPLPTVPLPETGTVQQEVRSNQPVPLIGAVVATAAEVAAGPAVAQDAQGSQKPLDRAVGQADQATGMSTSVFADVKPSVTAEAASDLSDLSDVDDDAAAPRDAKPASAERRKRASSSATPAAARYGPARTRRMLAAEAALLSEEAANTNETNNAAATSEVNGRAASSPLSTVSNTQRAQTPVAESKPARTSRSSAKPAASTSRQSAKARSRSRSGTPTGGTQSRESVQKRLGELIPRYQYLPGEEPDDWELVWARQTQQDTWWPAEACLDLEDEEREIPESLLESIPKACIGHSAKKELGSVPPNERMLLVNWFGSRREWGFVRLANVCKLKENDELDGLLVTPHAWPKKKAKSKPEIIKKAYAAAAAVAEIPEDLLVADD